MTSCSSLSCNWLITTDDALEIVKLKVLDTEMENSTDCSKDVVHVYDGKLFLDTFLIF